MISNFNNLPAESVAVIDSDNNLVTFGEIRHLAASLAKNLPERSLVSCLVENNAGGVALICALLLSGNVPIILNAHQTDLACNITDKYKAEFIFMPSSVACSYTAEVAFESYGYCLRPTGYPHQVLNPQLSHLLPTSGSTGSPKLVRHKYSNIEAAALNISTFFHLDSSHRPLLVLPLYYTMGLSVIFSHFLVGATVLVTGKSMIDPVFWRFIKDKKATSFTGVPASFEILDKMRFFRMDLPDLKLLTQGGGKMSRNLNIKFAKWCQDTGREWIATYGQSECTARMSWLPPEWAVDKVGSIGVPVPNGKMWLIGQDGQEIKNPFVEGELCYSGANVTMGYASTPDDLAKGDEWHGIRHTGDMAYMDNQGCYYISGRISRFIKVSGKRIGLDECEQIIRNTHGIECACVGKDEHMIVYLTDQKCKEYAKQTLISTTRLPATVFDVRILDKLPKNEAGKILYSKLKNE